MKLQDTSQIKNVSERDIDMLLLEELNVNKKFSQWFLDTAFPQKGKMDCEGAWHSVSDPELGESDLIILYGNGFAILVENKIDAPVQPRQGERYIERGTKGVNEEEWKSFGTCMVAPKGYLDTTEDSRVYDSTISYEDLGKWFSLESEKDHRASYKRLLIMEAIEQKRRGYSPETDEGVTEFWSSYWRLCKQTHSELEMKQPGYKPAGSDWPVFTPQLLSDRIPGARIIHKLAEGFVDLQVPRSFEFSERAENAITSLGASVEQTGRSKSVRLQSSPLDRSKSFDSQQESVMEGLDVAERMFRFSEDLASL